MTAISGQVPDTNLSLDLSDLIGRIRRANRSLHLDQETVDRMEKLTDEIVRWQTRLRKQVVDALGHHNMTTGWDTLVRQIGETRRERDSAQTLHRMAADDLRLYDETFTELRAELDTLRQEKRS